MEPIDSFYATASIEYRLDEYERKTIPDAGSMSSMISYVLTTPWRQDCQNYIDQFRL